MQNAYTVVPVNPKLELVVPKWGLPIPCDEKGAATKVAHRVQIAQGLEPSQVQVQYHRTTIPPTHNAFAGWFQAVVEAYNHHKDFVFHPDDFWMVICLNFTKNVAKSAESLRSQLVKHQGKLKLTVTDNHFEGQAHWTPFFEQMANAIRENTVGDVARTLSAEFSTTDEVASVLSSAVIMDVFKHYFEYGRGVPMCGFRRVLFAGTRDDWVRIKAKLLRLGEFSGFEKYAAEVSGILDKFLESLDGNADVAWWNNVMNIEHSRLGSGSTTKVKGWINKLFLGVAPVAEIGDFDLSCFSVPVVVENHATSTQETVHVVGGFVGYSEIDLAVRPSMSLVVVRNLTSVKSLV